MKKRSLIKALSRFFEDKMRRVKPFLADERGQAMTEYALLLGITVPICAWLWHPDNHFFNGIRRLYTRMKMVTMLPGP